MIFPACTQEAYHRYLTTDAPYPPNVYLKGIRALPQGMGTVRADFLIQFPISKSAVAMTLTLNPIEHTFAECQRIVQRKLRECAAVEFEEAKPFIDSAERMFQESGEKLVLSDN